MQKSHEVGARRDPLARRSRTAASLLITLWGCNAILDNEEREAGSDVVGMSGTGGDDANDSGGVAGLGGRDSTTGGSSGTSPIAGTRGDGGGGSVNGGFAGESGSDGASANCGNGVQENGERCDDGNDEPGDGCHECNVEKGWTCTGSVGSTCSDVDECKSNHGDCDPLVECENALGGWRCGPCPDTHLGTGETGCRCADGYWGPACELCSVKVSAAGGNDTNTGASWSSALATVQAGLNRARDRMSELRLTTCDVWVAAGVYTPSDTDRTVAIEMAPSVGLYGGFTGVEKDRSERDWVQARTELSGDLFGDDVPNNLIGNRAENSDLILRAADATVIDGFTLRSAENALNNSSGGSVRVANSTFQFNSIGARLTADGERTLEIESCSFANNGTALDLIRLDTTVANSSFTANQRALRCASRPMKVIDSTFDGNSGFSIEANTACSLSVIRSQFSRNTDTVIRGGASAIAVVNSRFWDNHASSGAALEISDTQAQVVGSVFYRNVASTSGGCFAGGKGASFAVINSTFFGNSAPPAGGSVAGSSQLARYSFENSILWGNSKGVAAGSATFVSSIVQDMVSVDNVRSVDPLFVGGGVLSLRADSPAIGAADASLLPKDTFDLDGDGNRDEPLPLDLDRNPRIVGTLDLGAYESQAP